MITNYTTEISTMKDETIIYSSPKLEDNCILAARSILSLVTEKGFITPYPVDQLSFELEVAKIIEKAIIGNNVTYQYV